MSTFQLNKTIQALTEALQAHNPKQIAENGKAMTAQYELSDKMKTDYDAALKVISTADQINAGIDAKLSQLDKKMQDIEKEKKVLESIQTANINSEISLKGISAEIDNKNAQMRPKLQELAQKSKIHDEREVAQNNRDIDQDAREQDLVARESTLDNIAKVAKRK